MYELMIVDNNRSLTNWVGQEEKLEIQTNHVVLDEETFALFKDGEKSFLQDEVINVIDVEVKSTLKRAEKMDINFAVFSGFASAAVDLLFVGKTDLSKINFKDLKKEDLLKNLSKALALAKFVNNDIQNVDAIFDEKVETLESKVYKAEDYKALVKDFASGLTVKGLALSIVEYLIGYHVGLDENGVPSLVEFTDEEKVNGSFYKKVLAGAVSWFNEQALLYNENDNFVEEKEDIVNLKKQFEGVKGLIKELADTKLYKENGFDSAQIKAELIKLINQSEDDEMQDLLDMMAIQAIPVVFNRCLVKTYLIVKSLVKQIKTKNIVSIEGLKYLSFNVTGEENKRVLARMNTVSTGVFAAVDVITAVAPAVKKGIKDGAEAFVAAPGEEKTKAVIGLINGAKSGAVEFASRINVANLINLVVVTKTDWEYIVEDIKRRPEKLEEIKFTKEDVEVVEDLGRFTTLNKTETKILYSLERQLIKRDVGNTKDSKEQIRKDKWCDTWEKLSEEATDIKKLFEKDEEKLYALIKTYLSNQGDNGWLRILLELSLFKPYFKLEEQKEDQKKKTKDKPLKLAVNDFIDEVVINEQKLIESKEYKGLMKNYKKHYDELGGIAINPVVGGAAAVAVTVATGGAAFVFAPAIATALVGGSFAGLYGVALTNASLALIGGGSLAVGGLGMAGGTAIIAGGGALIGLGTSGVTMAAFSLMTSSEFSRVDYAKLLTNCDYIMVGKYSRIKEVLAIADQIKESAEEYKTRYAILEEKLPDDKKNKKQNQELLKELAKSIQIMDDSAEELYKIVQKAKKNSK